MGRAGYFLVLTCVAGVFAAAAVAAQRRAGPRALRTTTVVSACVLLLLGYLDWQRSPVRESPLVAYVLAAVFPTTVAALLVYWTRRLPAALQWCVGAVSFILLTFPALIVGTYILGSVFRF